ncbi:isochorismatase family protein [Kineosporia sp. NBRC 101731]|uniref:isochorismatase family protein n=1 Tax=Kineosporia sp. NBRC 101731 TaxID=3032199 RepID=UPI0024A1E4B2|nr:isochorismatase family protein [Kineosporia sp. NBRC 101731]GLY32341.1 phenazine biosynthesis protein PhzD [Kineosporia sp. NBRC 101731]
MRSIAPIQPYPLPSEGDLPTNVATWQVDPARAVLLVHDLQHFFLRPFPRPLRDQLLARAGELLAWARGHGVQVAYSLQPGAMTPQQRGLLADVWGPGMSARPDDRGVPAPIAPREDDWQLTKWRYSAFVRSGLREQIQASGRDQLVVCGVYAHVGVLMTLADAFQHDVQTFLVADATGDFSLRDHRLALDYAASACAVVTTTKRVAP